MNLKTKFVLLYVLFTGLFCYSQNTTVYITSDSFKAEEDEPYSGNIFYTQIGFSIPITGNNESDNDYYYTNNNDDGIFDRIMFDGLSIHAGAGLHFKKWAAVGINTGIDARIKSKLVAVPVYGTVTLNPHFGGDASVLFQYGYGHAFALGRGDLSGAYSKYKLGVHIDNDILVYLDVSIIDFPLNDYNRIGSFSLGIDLLNFL